VEWTDECQDAFDQLKGALTQTPVLSYPLRTGQFYLSTNASDDGIGSVLEQDQIEDGKLVKKVIAYASKTLTRSQRRYCATNRELLAVVVAVEHFKYYLLGRHFTIITDHASLTWLHRFREPEGMVARWITRLSPFDYKIIHRPGRQHGNADGLSRRTSRPCKRADCHECAPLVNQVTTPAIRTIATPTQTDSPLPDSEEGMDTDDLEPGEEGMDIMEWGNLYTEDLAIEPKAMVIENLDQNDWTESSEEDSDEPSITENQSETKAKSLNLEERVGDGYSQARPVKIARRRLHPEVNPWEEISREDVRLKQDADEEILFVKQLRKTSATKPKWTQVQRQSPDVKNLWN
jgi:hypothetical protein